VGNYHEPNNAASITNVRAMKPATFTARCDPDHQHKKSRPKAAYRQLLWITVTGTLM